jgi:hypothetical protein
MDFAGEFETHITIRAEQSEAIDRLARWAKDRGLKFTHIVLARGETPSQPMLTQHRHGTLDDALQTAHVLAAAAAEDGFEVTRLKIEVPPWNAGVPLSDEESAKHPAERYFEHHLKLLIAAEADLSLLVAVAQRHAAHLSRNARRTRADGSQERFITQRSLGVGRTNAEQRFEALLVELAGLGIQPVEVEQEFVVYDSNAAVDAGWLVG